MYQIHVEFKLHVYKLLCKLVSLKGYDLDLEKGVINVYWLCIFMTLVFLCNR